MPAVFFLVSMSASVVGAICGIGGGVIIKPFLDMLGLAGVAEASFLSGVTVLAMSSYSVSKSMKARDGLLEMAITTPLAVGAIVGGVVGKSLFSLVRAAYGNPAMAGIFQSACLLALVLGTLAYTLFAGRIQTLRLRGWGIGLCIGLVLGFFSSFLGIGGGPMNLVVLAYFYSMEVKTAAQNSLYIILFSQAANLLWTIIRGDVPEFSVLALVVMVAGGICGGVLGRRINAHISSHTVDRLFQILLFVIMAICVFNIRQFAVAAGYLQ